MKSIEPRKWWRLLNNDRQNRQSLIDKQQTRTERNKKGQHATPFLLAKSIMSIALHYLQAPVKKIRFLEPAVGLGVFYSVLLELSSGIPPQEALGFEKFSNLAEISKALWNEVGLEVRNEDFTLAQPPEKEADRYDLIVTNPPYVRHHHLLGDKKRLINLISTKFGVRVSGLMGLYGYFLLLSHYWMKKDGVGVWLIPHEFMEVNYGSFLRAYLVNKVQLLRIHCFNIDDLQFSDADVSSTVIFFRNKTPNDTSEILFTFGPDIMNPESETSVKLKLLIKLNKWSFIENKLTVTVNKDALRLSDLFKVKRGLATGANKFFIMSMSKAKEIGIPNECLTPILPSSRYLGNIDIIEANNSGLPKVKPQLFLLNCLLPKDVLEKNYPSLYHYVKKGEAEGLDKRHLLSKRKPWYSQEIREPAPIIFRYMGRKKKDGNIMKFYRNKSKALVTNSYFMLYPRKNVFERIKDPSTLYDKIFEVLKNLDQREFIALGRSYGGGLFKIEPKELEKITLPSLNFN